MTNEAQKQAFFRDWKDAPKDPAEALGFQQGWYKGYDAHESAIRTAAEALVGVMEKLFNNEDGIIYGEDDIKSEFAALKAALATGKEQTK